MFPRAYFISGKDAGGQPEISLPDDGTSTSTTPVTIIKYAANQIEVNASVTTTGYLVLSEINYPGWRVTVDGQRQSLLTYRDIFRSVYLSPGQHQVVFSYAPAEFRWGLIVSILSLIGSLGIIITALIVRKNNPAKKIG